jgi:hypothetical protein
MSNPAPDATGGKSPWWIRAILIVLGLALWFWTQALIGSRAFPGNSIGDGLHVLTEPAHHYLFTHPDAANALLVASSACIDLLGIFLLGRSIFGPTIRPFLALMMVFALRQACQLVCTLPPPDGMIWRYPGFPSLLVTYGVSNDLFFSGHTAIAVVGAVELARRGSRWLGALGFAVALFEIITVLVLRAHYTMDVFTGAVTALAVSLFAAKLAPACDRALARLSGRS